MVSPESDSSSLFHRSDCILFRVATRTRAVSFLCLHKQWNAHSDSLISKEAQPSSFQCPALGNCFWIVKQIGHGVSCFGTNELAIWGAHVRQRSRQQHCLQFWLCRTNGRSSFYSDSAMAVCLAIHLWNSTRSQYFWVAHETFILKKKEEMNFLQFFVTEKKPPKCLWNLFAFLDI